MSLMRREGKLVPSAGPGSYMFALSCDNGCKLWIGGKQVVSGAGVLRYSYRVLIRICR